MNKFRPIENDQEISFRIQEVIELLQVKKERIDSFAGVCITKEGVATNVIIGDVHALKNALEETIIQIEEGGYM